MFGLQSVRSFFIACSADNESLYSDMLLRLTTLSLFSKTHNKVSFIAVSSAVKIVILSHTAFKIKFWDAKGSRCSSIWSFGRVCVYMESKLLLLLSIFSFATAAIISGYCFFVSFFRY